MKVSIEDIEKALRYAKKQHAVTVIIEIDTAVHPRLILDVSAAYKGEGSKITVFEADAAKMPVVTHTETLFE